jgi:hypothetical protein
MQSFKNLAEGTFDEAFAKIVHTKLYQIRLLRHNQFNSAWQTEVRTASVVNGERVPLASSFQRRKWTANVSPATRVIYSEQIRLYDFPPHLHFEDEGV